MVVNDLWKVKYIEQLIWEVIKVALGHYGLKDDVRVTC